MKDNTVREELIVELKEFDNGMYNGVDFKSMADYILANYIPKSAIEPLKEAFNNKGTAEVCVETHKLLETLTNCGEKL